MGVHGLWRLIEPSGKEVPLETLENKVLAVDVSIWLHQAIKGFQDSKGAPVPNAHLLGIYHRVCKLLYFKIKPIFVFDGGVPALKKQTIAKRNHLKSRNISEAERLQKQLLSTLMKHSAITSVLSEKAISSIKTHTKNSKNDMYALPSPEHDSTLSSSEDEESTTDTPDSSPTKNWDLHTIDMSSSHFKSLPVDVRHEILTELKETRKQSSWGRIHEIPKQSGDFSTYQMKRLLQRQSVQAALEEAAQEMGGASLSLAELESLLKDQGIPTTNDVGQRIASDENTRYLYIKDVKQAIERARKEKLEKESDINEDSNSKGEAESKEENPKTKAQLEDEESNSTDKDESQSSLKDENRKTKAQLEEEDDLQKAIALSLEEVPSTSKEPGTSNNMQFSFLEGFNDGDFQSDSSDEELTVPVAKKIMSSAADYMTEYSGLTPNEIEKIIGEKTKSMPKNTVKIISTIGRNQNIKHIRENRNDKVPDSDGRQNNDCSVTNIQEIPESPIKNTHITKTTIVDTKITKDSNYKAETEKNNSNNELKLSEVVDELSSSDSDDFLDVSEDPLKQNDSKDQAEECLKPLIKFEIQIDPSKTVDDDDLFGDIFAKSETDKREIPEMEMKQESTENGLHNKKIVDLQEVVAFKGTETTALETRDVKDAEAVAIVESENSSRTLEENSNEINENQVVLATKLTSKKAVEVEELSIEKMTEMKDKLQQEKLDLLAEKSTKERLASNITDQMYKEAQELLELFGVPYMIAPMEAEAQCAFLDSIDLTDGTITDDSDIWLFGGSTVYKNFFNQSKYVLEFNSENIKHHFKLSREQLILLALLVGSDYTTGIQGIGPVTALEILSAFPPDKTSEFSLSHGQLLSGLKEFKAWFTKGKSGGIGRASLRKKLKNIDFTENFPSLQVVEAYLDPKVETSSEKFSWAKPDIIALTVFARDKFGWSPKKTDEILKPIIKRLEESQTQKSIRDFFKTRLKVNSTSVEEKLSKRVKTALDRFGKSEEELIAEEMLLLEKEESKIKKGTKRSSEHLSKVAKTKYKDTKNEHENSGASKHKNDSESEPRVKHVRKRIKDKNREVSEDKQETQDGTDLPKKTNKKTTPKNKVPKVNVGNLDTIVEGNESQNEPKIQSKSEEMVDDLTLYANIAAELKIRTKRNNDLKDLKTKKEDSKWKKKKVPPKLVETIPEELKDDEDIQMLIAASTSSAAKAEDIRKTAEKELRRNLNNDVVSHPSCKIAKPRNEVIHQRLRDKSDLLRNKMKAIEVFRRSKKGPGYVAKGTRKRMLPKEDAELSEDSD